MLNRLFIDLGMVSYNVTDWQRAKKFYGETLELPVAGYVSDELGWMQFGIKDGFNLAISHWRGPDPMPMGGGGTAIFGVEDAYVAVEELRRKGVKCEDVIAIPQMVTYATFYDPDGNALQLAGPPPR